MLFRSFFDSDFRVSYVDSRSGKGSSDIKDADCLLLSDSIIDGKLNKLIVSYIESAKPIIGAGDFSFKTMNEVFGVKNSFQKNTINKKPISSNLVHPLVYGYEKTTWLIDGDLHNLTEASGVLPISYGQENLSILPKRQEQLVGQNSYLLQKSQCLIT